jgi:uncharacterized membrane protein
MSASPKASPRIVAIDWMRGLVMVLMAIDHASMFYNSGRFAKDSAGAWQVGASIPTAQFFTRWITHLCAPTFVFLAGTAIAISTARRLERGQSAASVDRDLLIRGAIIVGLDIVFMSALANFFILQVLYAIGISMILMVPLRRLGSRALLWISLGMMLGGELVTSMLAPATGNAHPLVALSLSAYFSKEILVPYPALPWLAMMMLGWAFGAYVVEAKRDESKMPVDKLLVTAGALGLGIFLLVRGINAYGNMALLRDDGSLVQWLHVSKYPPSLAFIALELGLMALILAALMRLETLVGVRKNGPILVFGQTALFFYLMHFVFLGSARAFIPKSGHEAAYIGAASVLLVLYPLCLGYRALKRKYPRSVLRFI